MHTICRLGYKIWYIKNGVIVANYYVINREVDITSVGIGCRHIDVQYLTNSVRQTVYRSNPGSRNCKLFKTDCPLPDDIMLFLTLRATVFEAVTEPQLSDVLAEIVLIHDFDTDTWWSDINEKRRGK